METFRYVFAGFKIHIPIRSREVPLHLVICDSRSQDRRKNMVCALHLTASEFTKVHYIGLEGTSEPCFLWVTEFPLFTRADSDKEFLAHGRWSSSHHPFTAPMCEDVGNLIRGDLSPVRDFLFSMFRHGKLAKKGPWSALRSRPERNGNWRRVRPNTRCCHARICFQRSASGSPRSPFAEVITPVSCLLAQRERVRTVRNLATGIAEWGPSSRRSCTW